MSKLSRKERDQQIRKNDMLSAAEKLFAEKGYYSTNVEDIAKTAEYAVGTLYLYFKSKEDIYLALLEKKAEELYEKIKSAIESVSTDKPLEKLYVLVRSELSYFEENKDFFLIYMDTRHELSIYRQNKEISKPYKYYKKHLKLTANILKELQIKKIILKKANSMFLSRLLNGSINSIVYSELRNTKKHSLKRYTDTIVNIFLNGVGIKV